MAVLSPLTLLLISSASTGLASPVKSPEVSNFHPHWREKIVGGTEADKGEFPFIVDIRKPSHMCAGSIINSEWIVTAAHCSQASASTYEIVAGEHDNSVDEGTEQRRSVVRIINHQHYNPLTIENDIALMKVSPPFELNDHVKAVTLAPEWFLPTPVETAIGWGKLTEGGSSPSVLMKVDVPYVSDLLCRFAYGANRIKDTMLCAGRGGKDACQGDSGGPLICRVGNWKILCGIVSWGSGCARPESPGVYTEVSHFGDWIDSNIKKSFCQ